MGFLNDNPMPDELQVNFDDTPFWWLTGYQILEPYDDVVDDPEWEPCVGVSFHWGRGTPYDKWGVTGIGGEFHDPAKLEQIADWFRDRATDLRAVLETASPETSAPSATTAPPPDASHKYHERG